MAGQLNGKVAIVTGSSAGLGEAIALMFASRGARVTLCGRDQERLRSVLDKAVKVSGGHKDRFITVQGDVTDQAVRKRIVDQTVERFGCLDILVANSGICGKMQPIVETTDEDYDAVMNTNLKAAFFLIKQAVPHLEKTKGNIVIISSIVATMVMSSLSTYSMTKAALDHLTRCLAVELGPKGIRVNSVNPGYFPTHILRNIPNIDNVLTALAESTRVSQPLKERVGVVEDVAEAVTFLASVAAGFITGEQIKVDGGRWIAGGYEVPQVNE